MNFYWVYTPRSLWTRDESFLQVSTINHYCRIQDVQRPITVIEEHSLCIKCLLQSSELRVSGSAASAPWFSLPFISCFFSFSFSFILFYFIFIVQCFLVFGPRNCQIRSVILRYHVPVTQWACAIHGKSVTNYGLNQTWSMIITVIPHI